MGNENCQYLSEAKFDQWKDKEFGECKRDIAKQGKDVAHIKGTMIILVPLLIAILTAVLWLVKNGIH